ncbi:MAG: hypothetical protein ACO1OG_12860 [Devosia sp.]
MQLPDATERDTDAVRDLITRTFMDALRQTDMTPLEALECAAKAIGLVYRDVALAHEPPRWCSCGWKPDRMADITRLKSALSAAALPELESDLAKAVVAGHG